MKSKDAVPLKKVIASSLGNIKSPKYLLGLDFAYADSNDIYQGALSNLLNGNTEKTLKCLIFGLDLERENTSLIHLARTMLFSLSEDFYESGGGVLRQKYSNLEKAVLGLKNKIGNLHDEVEIKEALIKQLELTIENGQKSFFFFFKRKRLTKQLQVAKIELSNLTSELGKLEDDFEKVSFLERVEEYMKVLGIVLEVCIFPARFSWAMA